MNVDTPHSNQLDVPDLSAPRTRADLVPAALRAVQRLGRCWALSDTDLFTLTGGAVLVCPASPQQPVRELSVEQLTRIGALLGIYTALVTLHNDPLASEWVHRPNTNEMFSGRSPLQTMLDGGVDVLLSVRDLLESRVTR